MAGTTCFIIGKGDANVIKYCGFNKNSAIKVLKNLYDNYDYFEAKLSIVSLDDLTVDLLDLVCTSEHADEDFYDDYVNILADEADNLDTLYIESDSFSFNEVKNFINRF